MHYLFLQVQKKDIWIIKFILESYENLMVVSTVDNDLPKIQVTIAPDFTAECRQIIDSLKQDFDIRVLDDPPHQSQGNY